MNPFEASRFIAKELLKEKAKLVILSGSAARGKEAPEDLDIAAVFERENSLLDPSYRKALVRRLESEVGFTLDLIDYNERDINTLIEAYNRGPKKLCWHLNDLCMDSVKEQWKGWPLAWIFGDRAKEVLSPYLCFQEEFQVFEGQDYLDNLRERTKNQ